MQVYLAGPRTGRRDYNRAAFNAAAMDLREQGHTVLSPVELDDPEDGMIVGGAGDPLPEDVYSRGLEKCIREMLAARVDAVVVLKGWQDSRGARLEVKVGEGLGKAILTYPTLEPLETSPERHPLSAEFHGHLHRLGGVHDQKQADYGREDDPFANVRASEDFGVPGWIGTAMRANDKMKRIQTASRQFLTTGEIHLANEGLVDAFDDLAVYAVIARVLFEDAANSGI